MEEHERVTHYTFHLFKEMLEFGVCINLFHWMAPLSWFVLWEDVQNCTGFACDAMELSGKLQVCTVSHSHPNSAPTPEKI